MSDNTLDNYEEKGFDIGQLSPNDWTITVEHRNRNRMKINFKLSREETTAFTNFKNQTKPDQISEENFIKSIFFLGLSTLETNLAAKITEELAKNDEDVQIPEEESVETPVEEQVD